MEREEKRDAKEYELDDEDKALIGDIFYEEIMPKLLKLDARLGNLSCVFAGERYVHWILRFQSKGSGLEIVDFEYDEEADALDIDL
jgi:hypothetical protein